MLKSIKIELSMTDEQKEEWKPMQIVSSNNMIPLSMLLEALHIPLDTMVRPDFFRGEWDSCGANIFNLEVEAKGRRY